jgi:hypothetical protein
MSRKVGVVGRWEWQQNLLVGKATLLITQIKRTLSNLHSLRVAKPPSANEHSECEAVEVVAVRPDLLKLELGKRVGAGIETNVSYSRYMSVTPC